MAAAVANESSPSPWRVLAWGGDSEAMPPCRPSQPQPMTARISESIEESAPELESVRSSNRIRPGGGISGFEDSDTESERGDGVVVPTMLPDTTVLFEDAAAAEAASGAAAAQSSNAPVEQPVLSLVSLNTRTAATVDILRGMLTVLPELPDASAAVRTVRISCGRDPGNTIVLKDHRVSLHHFTVRVRAAPGGRVVLDLLDQSSNGTWVDGKRVGRGRRVTLAVGDRIVALPAALVGRDGEVGYVLLHDTKGAGCNVAAHGETPAAVADLKSGPQGLPKALEQDLRCGICTDVLHRCLTLVPCGHNFCAVCLVKWRRRSTLCPGCRGPVRQAVQNLDVDRVCDTFVKAHPEAARSPEEIAALDRAACEPESAAHLRWLLRDPALYAVQPTAPGPAHPAYAASPQRHGTRQARPQSGEGSVASQRRQQPAAAAASAATAQRAAPSAAPQAPSQQRPQATTETHRPNRPSSACVIC